MHLPSEHRVFVDAKDRIFAVRIAPPKLNPGSNLVESFTKAMEVLRSKGRIRGHSNGRGRESWGFNSIPFGLTLGPGSLVILRASLTPFTLLILVSQQPHELNLKHNKEAIEEFQKDEAVQKWVNHITREYSSPSMFLVRSAT